MSTTTKIQWTDKTWNPVRGCSMVSAGCQNCYAMKQAHRFSGMNQPYENLTEIGQHGPRWNGNINMVMKELKAPLTWKSPCRVFVNSMSDLFHADVSDAFIENVFGVMAAAPQHTFQILTKRPERMRQWVCSRQWVADGFSEESAEQFLPNVWLGVSVENQETADERSPLLLQTSAAVRFVSAEPLLGSVALQDQKGWLEPFHETDAMLNRSPRLDWVIVGGESGPGARPCDVAWIRSIKDQCKAASVPCFVKQLGSYVCDRNDAGFDGDEPTSWPMDSDVDDPDNEWDYQGARIRIRLKDSKGGDWNEWPEDLRVREFPQ